MNIIDYTGKLNSHEEYINILKRGDYSEITDFGYDDIAFYDENNNYILFITTHEGNIAINADILE